jgi:hypothetical protein
MRAGNGDLHDSASSSPPHRTDRHSRREVPFAGESMPQLVSDIYIASKRIIYSITYGVLRRLDTLLRDQYGARDFEGILNILRSGHTGQAR